LHRNESKTNSHDKAYMCQGNEPMEALSEPDAIIRVASIA